MDQLSLLLPTGPFLRELRPTDLLSFQISVLTIAVVASRIAYPASVDRCAGFSANPGSNPRWLMHALLNIFGQTLRTLWAHKLRSILTMFGIAWSVGSLLLLAGVGEGFRNGNRRQLETFGKNFIFFYGGRAPAVHGFFVETDLVNSTAPSAVVSFGYCAARTPVCTGCPSGVAETGSAGF